MRVARLDPGQARAAAMGSASRTIAVLTSTRKGQSMAFLRMTDVPLAGKRVLIREDLNVPLDGGRIASNARLEAALPTLEAALANGATVLVLSHLGRPKEGVWDKAHSLAPVAAWLSSALRRDVPLIRDYLDGCEVADGGIVLLENCRMNRGEASDDPALAARYAALAEVFVMDAFGTAHRAQASTHAAIRSAAIACAGPLLAAELDALGRALSAPARPLAAIVGGSKVSTKLELLGNLVERVDRLIVGGGIANTFLLAAGHPIGRSLAEPDLADAARAVLAKARARGVAMPLPSDVVVAKAFAADAAARVVPIAAVAADDLILDIGPDTRGRYRTLIDSAGTIVWNGPVGVFEFRAFAAGTAALTHAVASSAGYSIAGGGDTLAAIERFAPAGGIDYVSTGGGAFLEFLEGKTLPAVAALEARAALH